VIPQLLNEGYLLKAAEATRLNLEQLADNWYQPAFSAVSRLVDDPAGDTGISPDDVREVIDELKRACEQLESQSDPESASMCIPSIPILAILQSELTSAALNPEQDPLIAQDDEFADWWTVDDIGHHSDPAVMRLWRDKEVARPRVFGDPRWLLMEVVKGWYQFKKNKVPFGGLPEQPVDIADDARIVLVGDWGSGLKRAQCVADRIRDVLADGEAKGKQQHVIHLGDVYYTGSQEEYEINFLPHWPVDTGKDIGSYTLCGNHDMYRGGHAYYGTALADARFARQAGKSVFALRNANWQFLGVDTAYDDKLLSTTGQVKWIEQQIVSNPGIRTTVLSHHPLWSAYGNTTGVELRKDIGHVLKDGDIDAWFWGHEHRCMVYNPQGGVQFSSCVGHGGIPSYLMPAKKMSNPSGLRYEYRDRYGTSWEPWNTFGFAVVDLDARGLDVRYINEFGTEHHREYVP
jgi:hypothetical protein